MFSECRHRALIGLHCGRCSDQVSSTDSVTKNILHGSEPKLAIYAPWGQSLTCRPVFLFPWIISPIALVENTGKYDHPPPESSLLHIAHVGKIRLIEYPIMKPRKLIEEAYLWHLFSGTLAQSLLCGEFDFFLRDDY